MAPNGSRWTYTSPEWPTPLQADLYYSRMTWTNPGWPPWLYDGPHWSRNASTAREWPLERLDDLCCSGMTSRFSVWSAGVPKSFFLQIGQYGYQKMQYFMLIPNLKTKFKKSVQLKSYSKKTIKKSSWFIMATHCPRTVIVRGRYVRGQ